MYGSGASASSIQAFRTLRLLRVFKLATKHEGLVILLEAITDTLRDVGYFSLLIFLYIYICALIGMDFFAYKIRVDNIIDENPVDPEEEGGVSPRLNFDNFWSAIITIFALLVNEDWNLTLYIFKEGYINKYLSYFYIIFIVCFGNFLLLQLF